MKEPITISLIEFHSYEDAWDDCIGDLPWKTIIYALWTGDDAAAGRIIRKHMESCIEALEEEINHGSEPSLSEIDEDNRQSDNRDRIGAMK